MDTRGLSLNFADRTNRSVLELVDICYSSLKLPYDGTLVTRPVDEIYQSQYQAIDENTGYPEGDDDVPTISSQIFAYPFISPKRVIKNLVVSVDSGVVPLGLLTGGGLAFALRGSAVIYNGDNEKGYGILMALLYNSGPLIINMQNKGHVFRYIGKRLGEPDLYVREINGKLIPNPSAIDTSNQIRDRCRSFIERIIQEEAIGVLAANGGGILLFDGALTYSFDTPRTYLDKMLKVCRDSKIDVCAISKRSRISIGGIPIDSLFDEYPAFVGYAPLLKVLEKEREGYDIHKMRSASDVTAGTEIFAARLVLDHQA